MNKQAWDDYIRKLNEYLGSQDTAQAPKNHKHIVWRIHEEGLPDFTGEAEDLKEHIMWTMNGLWDHTWEQIWVRMIEVRYNEKGLWVDLKYSLESLREDFALWAHRQEILDIIEAEERECQSQLDHQTERPLTVHIMDGKYRRKVQKKKQTLLDKLDWLEGKRQRAYRAQNVKELQAVKHDQWDQLETLAKRLKELKVEVESDKDNSSPIE
jgi:hypothetical protein